MASTHAADATTDLPAMVDAYSALLFRVAHSVLRNHAEAEDVVQDLFVRVLEHRLKLPEVRDLRVWLVRIAWNLALDRRRRIRPDQMEDAAINALPAGHPDADEAMHLIRRRAAVFREIDRLPAMERQALLLSTLNELSTVEIAVVLNRSESAVRALLHRARTRLREHFAKGGYA